MGQNIRLNWEQIVQQARKRRKERGLTQQHLAALAKVGRSTLVRFENRKGDVTLSSVLRILGVLDMIDRKQEGTLLLRQSEDELAVMFSPAFGGGAMEPKRFADQKSLDGFLEALGISWETRRQAMANLETSGSETIPRVGLSYAELAEHWPKQFQRSG
jgi:DNA-binding XRE family transcriptional regulator